MVARDAHAPKGREQPWSDETPEHGRLVVVTDNPIGRAVAEIARLTGRQTVLLADEEVEQTPLEWLAANPLGEQDALVLCDHDTPEMDALLRHALESDVGYAAMLASRSRAERTLASLAGAFSPEMLARLHLPAGLNIGGKAPGEIALSVVAEVVAWSYGRPGGPMRNGPADSVP